MTCNPQILNQNPKLSNTTTSHTIPSLYDYLLKVVDFRNVNHPRFKHKLADCLMIMILAMMSNFNSQRSMEDFCRNHFEFFVSVFGCGGVLPNHSLFNRVCIKLDFESLGEITI
jgi:hypothetical protein